MNRFILLFFQFDVLSKVVHIDSLDHINKESSSATTTQTLPWQYDLQLNLETWKQVAKHGDIKQTVLSQKPLKLNLEYLQEYVERAKTCLKKRSQHDLLLNHTPSS